MTWWHGGPRIVGDMVLPAKQTGATPLFSDPSGEWVYISNVRLSALLYASGHASPWIYEVEPIGDLHDDPDLCSGDPQVSQRCSAARIVRRFKPSNDEVATARLAMVTS